MNVSACINFHVYLYIYIGVYTKKYVCISSFIYTCKYTYVPIFKKRRKCHRPKQTHPVTTAPLPTTSPPQIKCEAVLKRCETSKEDSMRSRRCGSEFIIAVALR